MNELNPERWSQLWHTVADSAPTAEYYERLVAMYSEPHRHYHNLRHIADCLREFEAVRHLAREPVAVELAIWFHDGVYDPRAGDNEERSAALACDWLKQSGATSALTHSVSQLVLATKAHDGTLHPDAPLLVDVDLSILGQPPDRFWDYERAIRAEYASVDPKIYTAKRAEILDRFLARPRLYHTEYFFARFESRARANLHASIDRLRNGITG